MKYQSLKIISSIFLCLIIQSCQPTLIKNQPLSTNQGYVDSSDGVPIYYTKTANNTGTTIVFIHCLGCNQRYWEPQVKYFSKNHQVITLDLAGHGLSDSERDNFTIDLFANDVLAVLTKLQLNNVVLVGQSLGSSVAIASALKHAAPITGVITINTFETNQQWPNSSEIESILLPFRENFYKATFPYIKSKFAPYTDKTLIYKMSKEIALTPPDIGVSSLENFYQWNSNSYQHAKAQISIPLIHINSQLTRPPLNNKDNIIQVKTSAHFLPQETPNKFNLALEQVLMSISTMKND